MCAFDAERPSHGTVLGADVTVVVLAGGRASRLGQDKAFAMVNGRNLLAHVLDGLPMGTDCIVVGPPGLPLPTPALRVQEDPPFGGPVAGLAAAIDHVTTAYMLVLAVDMPLGFDPALRSLADLRHPGNPAQDLVDAVIPIDEEHHRQPLCAAYRTAAVRQALAALPSVDGASMRVLVAGLRVRELTGLPPESLFDVDYPEDLVRAGKHLSGQPTDSTSAAVCLPSAVRLHDERKGGSTVMDEWLAAACAELDIEGEIDVDAVPDLARDVAHGVERPAAPVSTFLLGLAVGRGGDLKAAAAQLTSLANGWQAQ